MKTLKTALSFLLLLLIPWNSVHAQVLRITYGKNNYRSVVKNGRIIISSLEDMPGGNLVQPDYENATPEELQAFVKQALEAANQTAQQVDDPAQMLPLSLYLYDVRNSQSIELATKSALHWSLAGPPDLDENGSAVWLENRNGAAQVILWNGIKEIQLTSNSEIPGSPALGTLSLTESAGYPRIFYNDVVFRNKEGDVFFFDYSTTTIKKVNNSDQQTANAIGKSFVVPAGARLKNFEFDGTHITWLHKNEGTNGNGAFSVLRASYPAFEISQIASFQAWSPAGNAVAPGSLFDPFFVACGQEVAWMYLPPSTIVANAELAEGVKLKKYYHQNMEGWNIRYSDGNSQSNVATAVPAQFHSLRIFKSQLAWIENPTDQIEYNLIKSWQGGSTTTVTSHPEPPTKANEGALIEDRIVSLGLHDGVIAWATELVRCEKKMKEMYQDNPAMNTPRMAELLDACSWMTTGYAKVRSTASPGYVLAGGEPRFAGGSGEFDRGLFVFELSATKGKIANDIGVVQLYGNALDTDASLGLLDTKPKHLTLDWEIHEKTDPHVVDAFRIKPGNPICGSTLVTTLSLKEIQVNLEAESGILADLNDIESLDLYQDLNKNGEVDPDDLFLGSEDQIAEKLSYELTDFELETGEEAFFVLEMKIKQEACPCNRYRTFIDAEKDISIENAQGVSIALTGSTEGFLILPEPEFIAVDGTNMFAGDNQAWFKSQILPDELIYKVKNFPSRCGQAHFSLAGDQDHAGAVLIKNGQEAEELIFDLEEDEQDALARVRFRLGEREGLYNIKATIKGSEPEECEQPYHLFRAFAGNLKVELVDLNRQEWLNSSVESGGDPSGRDRLSVSLETSPLTLATGGRKLQATSADGTSALLIRARLVNWEGDLPTGEVKFQISGENAGSLTSTFEGPLPYQGEASISQMEWKQTDAGIYAFAVYTPPLNFASPDTDRPVNLEVSYEPPEGEEMLIEDEIRLYRCPILLVHGMWSGPETWGHRFTNQDPRYETFLMDYSSFSAESFSSKGALMKKRIKEICDVRRNKGIATAKTVVVAHSMGGLITRQHIAENNGLNYSRIDNFGRGDVYKFITMGTPHWGSPVAWLTKSLRDHPDATVRDLFNATAAKVGKDIHSGAVDAMCPGSSQLEALGKTYVPTHTIAAWYYDTGGEVYDIGLLQMFSDFLETVITTGGVGAGKAVKDLLQEFAVGITILFADVTASQLYTGDQTDFLVTKVSQTGGISQYSTFDKTMHMGLAGDMLEPDIYYETNHPGIAQKVWELMEADVDDGLKFADFLPKPEIQSPGIVDCKTNGPPPTILTEYGDY